MSYEEASNIFKKYGVNPNQNKDQLKTAYRQLVKKYHSDLTGNDDTILKDINAAYDVLKTTNHSSIPSTKFTIYSYDGKNMNKSYAEVENTHLNSPTKIILKKISIPNNIVAIFYVSPANDKELHLFWLNKIILNQPIQFDITGNDPEKDHSFMESLPNYLNEIYQEHQEENNQEKWYYYKKSANNPPKVFWMLAHTLYEKLGVGYIDDSTKSENEIYKTIYKSGFVKTTYNPKILWTISYDDKSDSIIFHFKDGSIINSLKHI